MSAVGQDIAAVAPPRRVVEPLAVPEDLIADAERRRAEVLGGAAAVSLSPIVRFA